MMGYGHLFGGCGVYAPSIYHHNLYQDQCNIQDFQIMHTPELFYLRYNLMFPCDFFSMLDAVLSQIVFLGRFFGFF